ncbi:uncharacterized protein LOC108106215, partial [Drosophila eugracilis]|uniref:uncharacterized protein LOC108106215 n=1 Tax=Drosophila eugracilis TaxID=29029 RepID=UPI0007E82EEC
KYLLFPQPVVFRKGNINIIFESLATDCDHEYVDYFYKVPNSSYLYTFRVVKQVSVFTIDVIIKMVKSKTIFYKAENIKGCDFLNNPLLFKLFGESYKHLVVNGSFFKCPIQPKVYYLKYEAAKTVVPRIHPPGHFQVSMRVKVAESSHPYVMEMLWKYKIRHIK